MDVNKHERLSNITLRHRLKWKLVVRYNMNKMNMRDYPTLHLDTD